MYNGSCTLGLEVVYNSSVFPFRSSLFVMLKGSAFLRVGIAHAATSFVREGRANTPTGIMTRTTTFMGSVFVRPHLLTPLPRD